MALVELSFPPGLYANGTLLQAAGRWHRANLVRFHSGTVRPWGGWAAHSGIEVTGRARAMITWTDNAAHSWIAIGTHSNLQIMNRVGALYDITPGRPVSSLLDAIVTEDGSATVEITDVDHGAHVGDRVRILGAAPVGGITVDGIYEVTATPDEDTFCVVHSEAADSDDDGGGVFTVSYLIEPGYADADYGGGFGTGDFGEGDYGSSSVDGELVRPATVWSLDTFGENLVACHANDGALYRWDLSVDEPAEQIPGSPELCRALVVTETGHLMALGAGNDGRMVQWSDAQDEETWSVGLPSEAGNFPLQTGGRLMCGKRTRGGTLLLTDQDAWLAIYNGGANPFSFDQVGVGCGVISQGAAVAAGTTLVAWIGADGFWMFNGDVQPLPCDVSDYVFSSLNRLRASHVTGYHRRQYGEMIWHYPSADAVENDRYVAWNYREGHWVTGELSRTCGADRGALPYPLAADVGGKIWRHETGFDYVGDAPFIESGPVQFGAGGEAAGERVFTALDLIPDEKTLGQVKATFKGRLYPSLESDAAEETFGPYEAANPTNVRFTTRHLRMILNGATPAADWRVGTFKLDIQLGGLR